VRLNLKTAILRAGTSQRRAALCCGISENRFSSIVQGWVDPRPEEKARIAAFLKIPPTDSLFDAEMIHSAGPEARTGRR
jgi:hypothetical protein